MGVLETGKELEKQRRDPVPLIIGAVVVLLGLGAVFYLVSQHQGEEVPVLTPEAEAYLPNLDLAGVEMAASDTFLDQTLVEITGKIKNIGSRTVSLVQIYCVFRDVNGVEIARELSVIVGPRTGSLSPQEEQAFRLAFDNLPADWNQVVPSLFVAQIEFEDAAD
ncbi:MAG: FxLYD domain-containing protein [Bryobacterales bacterium]